MSGFFHIALGFQGSSTLYHVSELHLFLLSNNRPLYRMPYFAYLFISSWAFELLHFLGYYVSCCYEQACTFPVHIFVYSCFISLQFSSVAQSCPTLCDPMNRSTPGLPVHHQLLEFTQTHVHRVIDAIQPSHPRSSPSPAPNPSQHQSLFQ